MDEAGERVRLFIASIGERDPASPSGPTGPLRGARELRPERVVLVAAPGVEQQAEATRVRIARELPDADVAVETLPVADPTHLDALLAACGQVLERLLAPAQGGSGVAVCASSGTPQISLALTLAALARAPGARHFQALDPAKTDTPWREFDPDALRHHTELDAGLQMLASCRFEEAAALLERRAASAAIEARAHRRAILAARAAATALERANALDVGGAFMALNVSTKRLPRDAASALGSLHDWYAHVKTAPKKNPKWPAELAARAAREMAAGRVPQALVAAAIAFEAALAVRFHTQLGLNPDLLSPADLSKLEVRETDAVEFAQGVFRIEGAKRRSEALATADTEYRPVHGDGRRERLLERRNDLVHKAKAPSRADVDEALAFLDAVFRALGWPVPSQCPSAPDSIRALVAALRPAAGLA